MSAKAYQGQNVTKIMYKRASIHVVSSVFPKEKKGEGGGRGATERMREEVTV